MTEIPERLLRALEAQCAEDLSEIIRVHHEADFVHLRQVLAAGSKADPRYRLRAIYALGRWGDARAVDDILRVMPGLDEPGRLAALDSLGRLGSVQALPVIFEGAADPSPHVRKFAIHALGKINLSHARAKLIEISQTDPDPALRILASQYIL